MITQIKWVNLSFDTNIPPGKFPAIIERLAGTPSRLEEKLQNAPYLILTQPYNNGWSIQEHAGHLVDLEELVSNRLDDFELGKDLLTAADMTNKKTYAAKHNKHEISAILKNFIAIRTATIKRLQAYDETMIKRTAMHPRLQVPMSITDVAHFFAEHDDHHLATISNITKELS